MLPAVSVLRAVTAEAQSELIANPSAETGSGTAPTGWSQGRWGTNTAAFTWATNGHTGSRSLSVNMTAYSSGDAKWFFTPVAVTPSTQYAFSDWYQSTVPTQLTAEIRSTAGALSYVWLGDLPASATWQQTSATFTTPANAAAVTVYHIISSVGTLQTDDFSLVATSAPPAPTVTLTAPTAGATVSGSVSLAASTTGSGVLGVQFRVDGANVGTEDTTAPYSLAWDSTSVANGSHSITATARTASTPVDSAAVAVTVSNTAPPPLSVSVTAPAAGATVSGAAVTLSASTTGSNIQNVQFKVDGANVGSADTTSPYSATWNTTTATNASHTITAVVTSPAGTGTSTPVTVTVNNTAPPAGELVPNPSLETTAGSDPASWARNSWGTMTATFSYPTTGAHSGSRFVRVDVTQYSSGDAKWYFSPVAVTPNQTHRFTDWYRSNVATQAVVAFEASSGGTTYQWLGDIPAATTWTQFSTTFEPPTGTVRATVYHLLPRVGWLETDDFSLTPLSTQGFTRGLVSLTFDDGWASHSTQAKTRLEQLSMRGTFYVTSGFLGTSGYMTNAQVVGLRNGGHEIASHTVSHPHLPQLSSAQQNAELQNSKTTLEGIIGAAVPNFCTPYGEYNDAVLTKIKGIYASHRTVFEGLNTRAATDVYQLKVRNIFSTTTRAQVESWVAAAKAQNAWLILVYHNIVTNPDTYDTTPTMLTQHLQGIQASGVAVRTVQEALTEVVPQL